MSPWPSWPLSLRPTCMANATVSYKYMYMRFLSNKGSAPGTKEHLSQFSDDSCPRVWGKTSLFSQRSNPGTRPWGFVILGQQSTLSTIPRCSSIKDTHDFMIQCDEQGPRCFTWHHWWPLCKGQQEEGRKIGNIYMLQWQGSLGLILNWSHTELYHRSLYF